MKYTFLTQQFYDDHTNCPQILQKKDRPHVQLTLVVNGITWCIPMRSHVTHPHAYITDRTNHCGVDFSKAVAIVDTGKYLDTATKPHIRPLEFNALRGKEYILQQKFQKYIREYKHAKANIHIQRNQNLVTMSTLQYFEQYI